MEDKKPSARKTDPKQVDQRRKQAFSKQLQSQRIGQEMEQAPPASVPIDSWRANAPEEGWEKPILTKGHEHPADQPKTSISSSDASASNAPHMDSAHETAPSRETPRQQVIRQHREQFRVEARDNRAQDAGFTQTRERILISGPTASARATADAGPREAAKPASSHSDSRKMPKDHVVKGAVRHAQAAVEKVRDEVNEQPDVSPSQYAEQKVESYTGTALHKTESALGSAGTALRKRAIRQFQEKREEEHLTDREQSSADAEIRREETFEAEQPGYTTDSPAPEPPRTDPGTEPVTESGQPDAQARENAKKHLTYRDRSIDQQTMEPADRNPSTGSSISEEGGSAHAQGQTKRSEWQKNASGLRVQDPYGRAPSTYVSKAEDRAVSPAKNILPGTEKEAHYAAAAPEKTVKGIRKTLDAGRTAQQTTRTVQQTTKTAQKAAQTSARAAQATKEASVKAGRAAVKVGQAASKLLAAVVRAITEGVKALVTAILEGGWVVVLVIAMIGVFAVLLNSAFGLFWSNETEEGRPMSDIVRSINADYEQEIENRVQSYEQDSRYDEVQVVYKGDNDGDSASVNNWNDVLAVYSVLTTTDETNPRDVITPSAEDEAGIRAVFRVMNQYYYRTRVEEEVDEEAEVPKPTPDKDGKIPEVEPVMKTVLYLTITQDAMTYKEAARYYGFTDFQMEILEEMMSPRYFTFYAALIGVDLTNGTDLTEIMTHLPSNSKGAEVVKAALSKLGAPYVWGAKGENKFDCSGLAYWSIKHVDPVLGDRMYTNAAGQAKYCYDRGRTVARSELQPGDLVFWVNLKCEGCHRWKEIHHVGIYIGYGKVCEASSGHGRVIVRDLWESKNYPIYMFGRPYSD